MSHSSRRQLINGSSLESQLPGKDNQWIILVTYGIQIYSPKLMDTFFFFREDGRMESGQDLKIKKLCRKYLSRSNYEKADMAICLSNKNYLFRRDIFVVLAFMQIIYQQFLLTIWFTKNKSSIFPILYQLYQKDPMQNTQSIECLYV